MSGVMYVVTAVVYTFRWLPGAAGHSVLPRVPSAVRSTLWPSSARRGTDNRETDGVSCRTLALSQHTRVYLAPHGRFRRTWTSRSLRDSSRASICPRSSRRSLVRQLLHRSVPLLTTAATWTATAIAMIVLTAGDDDRTARRRHVPILLISNTAYIRARYTLVSVERCDDVANRGHCEIGTSEPVTRVKQRSERTEWHTARVIRHSWRNDLSCTCRTPRARLFFRSTVVVVVVVIVVVVIIVVVVVVVVYVFGTDEFGRRSNRSLLSCTWYLCYPVSSVLLSQAAGAGAAACTNEETGTNERRSGNEKIKKRERQIYNPWSTERQVVVVALLVAVRRVQCCTLWCRERNGATVEARAVEP